MPESKTLVGRVLNAILDEDTDDEELREQKLDAQATSGISDGSSLSRAGWYVCRKPRRWLVNHRMFSE